MRCCVDTKISTLLERLVLILLFNTQLPTAQKKNMANQSNWSSAVKAMNKEINQRLRHINLMNHGSNNGPEFPINRVNEQQLFQNSSMYESFSTS